MKFLTSIRPGAIAKRANKKLGSAKNFISGSSFFGKRASQTGGSGLGGLAQGKVKAAPNGISSLISNISQTIGGDTNNVNITKLIGDKVSQSVNKISGNLPNFDGIMSSLNGISDYMKSFTDPSMLDGLASGFSSVKSSLEGTIDLVSTVQKVITKLVKQLNDLKPGKGGGGGGLLGGLGMGLAGLAGGGAMAAAGKKGLGFAKFLSSKKSLALMGLGAVGASAMGASQAQAADISTEQRMLDAPTGDGMPSDQVALFNSTVSKFEKYLEDAKKKRSSGPGTKGKGSKSPNPPRPPGTGQMNVSDIKADTPEEKAFIATVREAEGTSSAKGKDTFFGGVQFGGDLSTKTVNEVVALQKEYLKDPRSRFYNAQKGKWDNSAAVGIGQWMEPEVLVQQMGLDPSKEKFTEELQTKMLLYMARSRGVDPMKMDESGWKKANKIWAGLGPEYGQTSRTIAQTMQEHEENLREAKASTARASSTSTQQNLTAQTQLQQLGGTAMDPLDTQATFQQPQPQGASGLTILPLPPAPPPKSTGRTPTPQVTTAPAIPFLPTGIADPNQAAACAIYNICPK